MKILILGADGMIGHKMAQVFYKLNFDLFLNTRTQSEFFKIRFPNTFSNILCSIFLNLIRLFSRK